MTHTQADTYIAHINGAQGSAGKLLIARDALAAAMEDLTHRHDWSWLLMDTAHSFTVTNCVKNGTATVTHATNGLAGILAGMTVSGTGITVGTTVLSVESDGSLTLSAIATDSLTSTLTFGGTIPIVAGTDQYKLRRKFFKPYSCQLISTVHRPLVYVEPSQYDKISFDQTIQGPVTAYTIYSGNDFDASGSQATYIRFFRVPSQADVARLRFYRTMVTSTVDADPVDVDGRFLYLVLDLARVLFLELTNATDRRLPYLRNSIEQRIARAVGKDFVQGGEDSGERIHTPNERAYGAYDGQFYPHGDEVMP